MKRIVALVLTVSGLLMAADTIVFRDGKSVTGSYLGGDSRQVRMVVGDKIQNYSIPDIAKIEFGTAATTASAPPTPAPTQARPDSLQPSRLDTPATPPPASSADASVPRLVEIPSGTNIVVRFIDPVDSATDTMGKTYRASLDEPIIIGGETIASRGADIVAKLVEDKQSGKLSGKTELTLDLVSIKLNGKVIEIDTEEVTQSSGSRTVKSGKVIGGITALGAIIGGIAGGGKGAAVGAVSGAGAGTAVQVLTKGQQVKIPSETRLTFILQSPVRL